jgi:16S rRNA (guanine527-N7)-methyltransferase
MMSGEKSNEFLEEIRVLADGAASFGIGLSSSELRLFNLYLEELWEWNRRFNLTGLKTRERMVIELFLDSLIPAPFLPERATMLDVGSGAGFPGLPLKIRHPGLQAYLLEANSKKVSFLKQVIRTLALQGVGVIQGRVEAHQQTPGYEVITARAVASLNRTLPWCSSLLSDGGILVLFLGFEGEKDIGRSEGALDSCGLRVDRTISYTLPGRKTQRHTFILKKTQ